MIFVTVGMQLGFDRLIRAMDEIALKLDEEVIAQIGIGQYVPHNISFQRHYLPEEIETLFDASRLIIAHAGIGTVLAAQRHAKPLVILPRWANLGEHRNDHQIATARQLHGRPGIAVALEIDDLADAIGQAANMAPPLNIATPEQGNLKQVVANFIESGNLAP